MVIIFSKTLEKKKGVNDVRSKNIERRPVRESLLFEFHIIKAKDSMINSKCQCSCYSKCQHRGVKQEGPGFKPVFFLPKAEVSPAI